MPSPLFWFALPAGCILAAILVLATHTNVPLFVAIHHASIGLSAAFWQNVTLFGNGFVALCVCAVWLRRHPAAICAGLFAALPAALVARLFKTLIDVPRPLAVLGSEVHPLGPAYRHSS